MKYTWRYGTAASVAADFYDGLGLVEMRGPITDATLRDARLKIIAEQPSETRVYLICWDRAILATTFETLAAALAEPQFAALLWLPVANVVSREQAPAFRRYAARLVNSGPLRVTFCERGEALRWAARKLVYSEPLAAAQALPPAQYRALADGFGSAGLRRTA